jgi:hypothetical protein
VSVAAVIIVAVTFIFLISGPGPTGRATFVKEYERSTGRVRAYIRGLGKPSLVFKTLILALVFAAVVLRAAGQGA